MSARFVNRDGPCEVRTTMHTLALGLPDQENREKQGDEGNRIKHGIDSQIACGQRDKSRGSNADPIAGSTHAHSKRFELNWIDLAEVPSSNFQNKSIRYTAILIIDNFEL